MIGSQNNRGQVIVQGQNGTQDSLMGRVVEMASLEVRQLVRVLHSIPMCCGAESGQEVRGKGRNSSHLPASLQHPLDVLQFNSSLNSLRGDSIIFCRFRAWSHKAPLYFRCQSQAQVDTCASDQLTIDWRIQQFY